MFFQFGQVVEIQLERRFNTQIQSHERHEMQKKYKKCNFMTATNSLHAPNVLSLWSGGENTNTNTKNTKTQKNTNTEVSIKDTKYTIS